MHIERKHRGSRIELVFDTGDGAARTANISVETYEVLLEAKRYLEVEYRHSLTMEQFVEIAALHTLRTTPR